MMLDLFESVPEIHEKIMRGDDFIVRDMRNMLRASKDSYCIQTNNNQLNSKLKKRYAMKQLQHARSFCTAPQNTIGSDFVTSIARAINFSTGDLDLKQKWFEVLCSHYKSDDKNICREVKIAFIIAQKEIM